MALLVIMAAAAPLRLNDARDTDMLIVFHPIKGWYERQVWRRGDRRRRQRWDNVCRRTISEMESGPMVDESWQQRKCDGFVPEFTIRYKIQVIQSPKSTLNSNLSVVQNVTINHMGRKTLNKFGNKVYLQWMDDHITITTKVEEILDVDISQIHSVLNSVFDAYIAG